MCAPEAGYASLVGAATTNDEASPASTQVRPRGKVARGTGFEPVAFGSGVGPAGSAAPGGGSQALATSRGGDAAFGTRLPEFAGFSSPLGTPVVQRGPEVGEPRYVGVRELARVLGVSRATIYRAVERGELRAVRVSSVIRILVDGQGPA
jgi:excisionase family DNA binding protein